MTDCQELVEGYGIAGARRDPDLAELNAILRRSPVISALMERILIWYDYGVLPQAPRTPEEQALFEAGLEHLTVIQIAGRTAILLDDAEDYLSRGWCTLESVAADTLVGAEDLLFCSERRTSEAGRVEFFFQNLLKDRPHLIWRAVLDTEVLRLQSAEKCLARLGLAVTDPNDIPLIYRRLSGLSLPQKIHIDESEIRVRVVQEIHPARPVSAPGRKPGRPTRHQMSAF